MRSKDNLKISPTLLRLGIVLLGLILVGALAFSPGKAFVAEAQYSKALSKGRVLLRGAQLVATQRLVAGDTAPQVEGYLTTPGHLAELQAAADYQVEALSVTRATLDENGLLTDFVCSLIYEEQPYTLTFDLPAQQATATPKK